MTHFKKLSTTTAMVMLMSTAGVGGAFADVTAAQVWGDYKSYMEGFGYSVTSDNSTSGDTLTIKDMSITVVLPEVQGTMTMTYGEMFFTSNSDGTVTFGMPANMPLTIAIRPENDKPVDISLDYTQSDMSILVSGDAGDLVFDFDAKSLGVELAKLAIDGKPIEIGTAAIAMNSIAGKAAMKTGNLRTLSESGTIGTLTYDLALKDPDDNGSLNAKGALSDVTFDVAMALPLMFDQDNMAKMIKAGFAVSANFNHKGSTMAFDFVDGNDAAKFDSTSTSGGLGSELNEAHLQYGLTTTGMAMTVSGNEIPFPVSFGMAATAFKLMVPITKSDAEQDFSLLINLGDFTMSDMIWGIIDAGGKLPHDAATVAIDLSGKAKLLFDLMDPNAMKTAETEVPGQVNAVTINSLTVSAAGAELTGAGDFTFDNTDMTTFDGIPAPTGAADLKLVGANGLMDKLVAMGILSQDKAMGARMMMGMFTVTAGDDVLTSKIEVTGDGKISANGQRLK